MCPGAGTLWPVSAGGLFVSFLLEQALSHTTPISHTSSHHTPSDDCLGAGRKWPPVPALLVIDSFAPDMRGPVLEQAAAHRPGVWVLKQHNGNPKESVLVQLRRVARLQAESPKNSRVLHQVGSWEIAALDVESSSFSTQLWKLYITTEAMQKIHHPGEMPQLLDCEGSTGVKIQSPHGFSFIVSINKMLYDTPGTVLLLVLTAVWMSTMW